jgi:peptidoglycan/LPS O-acetylase OafA/YrhL
MDVSWSPDRQEIYNVSRTLSEESKVSVTELTYRRSAGIDFLRGLSILAVVLLHLWIHIPKDPGVEAWPWSIHSVVFQSGYYGVIVFLVISGFLITSISLRRWGSIARVGPIPFYKLRIARIAPPLALLILILIPLHLLGVAEFVIPPEKASLGTVVLAAATFRINTLEATGYFLPACWGVLWSLSIEETFYLGFPIASRILKREWLFAVLLGVFVILGPIARTYWPDNDDHTYLECMDPIAFGCLAAIINAKWKPKKIVALLIFAVGLAAVFFIEICRHSVQQLGLTQNGLYVSVLGLGTSFVLFSIQEISAPSIARIFAEPICFAGRYSYEIYLSHGFIVLALAGLFVKRHLTSQWVIPLYIAGLFACVFLGYLIAIFFSEPANRLVRRCSGVHES